MKLTPRQIRAFQQTVWSYYDRHARDMPWRRDTSLYAVLVSELMLQQTQVARVIPKFEAFMSQFPTLESLAAASLADVLIAWQGLGYNRRAKYLHDSARQIARSEPPRSFEELVRLPGIGPNTAGALMAYTYNQPVVFIETNIRTVYIHEFFGDRTGVGDSELRELVAQTLDDEHPREWYWALMDYGAYLKQTDAHLSQSKHYKRQSPLEGSLRQMRGMIIRRLSAGPSSEADLYDHFADERVEPALVGLIDDGLVVRTGTQICLTGSEQTS